VIVHRAREMVPIAIDTYTAREAKRVNHMIAQRVPVAPRRRRAAALRNKRTQGYSLMELMIVVVITGVLAAIAIPTFGDYVQKSRTSEATQFLGVIKLKQEAYRAEFGRYDQCPDKAKDFGQFDYKPGDASVMKNAISKPITGTDADCFNQLGAKPDGAVRFGYAWIAGTPGEMSGGIKTALGLADSDVDHYFIAHATTDLNGDGNPVVFELTNFTRNVFIMDEKDNPLAAGWD
jgi:prepilin-type N-terminal cleavage/methylation domain-containing protein